jgi:hypothetical protein
LFVAPQLSAAVTRRVFGGSSSRERLDDDNKNKNEDDTDFAKGN